MKDNQNILITGANGEIGHGLIPELAKNKNYQIVVLDINVLDPQLKGYVKESVTGSVTDKNLVTSVFQKYKFTTIFHLAAILSTAAEKDPERAHDINVNGAANLLAITNQTARDQKLKTKFIFPSTIGVYGLPDVETKQKAGAISEPEYLNPITIYGITKLYCEKLGVYYSSNYQLLATSPQKYLDFRCVRFPGIVSALTTPTGGTSDYAPEMIHAAAKGEGYESFVRPDAIIPFMVMPDAIKALLQLTEAPYEKLTQLVYNVEGFSATANDIANLINQAFPDSSISYNPDRNRQKIVDSWPAAVDDSKARSDWGWQPSYGIEKAFNEYLIPEISNKYK